MEQFRNLYKPILRPVRPGEKRRGNGSGSGNGNSSGGEAPRFDFAKRFAKVITAAELEAEKKSRDPKGDTENPAVFKASSVARNGDIAGALLEIGEEPVRGFSAPAAPPTGATSQDPLEFKPVGVPRLNFARNCLLGAASQAIDPKGAEAIQPPPTEQHLQDPSSDSALGSVPELALDLNSAGNETDATHRGQGGQANRAADAERQCDKHLLDQVMSECRGAYIELEKELLVLEGELPQSIACLDEKIALLHNLRLDFMLELGDDGQLLH